MIDFSGVNIYEAVGGFIGLVVTGKVGAVLMDKIMSRGVDQSIEVKHILTAGSGMVEASSSLISDFRVQFAEMRLEIKQVKKEQKHLQLEYNELKVKHDKLQEEYDNLTLKYLELKKSTNKRSTD